MLAERWSWNTPEEVEPPFGLPTEDEWEYLCSGGVHTLFPWGDTLELEPIYNETFDKDTKKERCETWRNDAMDKNIWCSCKETIQQMVLETLNFST